MKNLTAIVYHYVRPVKNSQYPNLKALEKDTFIKQLDYLLKNYSIISHRDLVKYLLFKKEIKNPCILTFDDGYKDHIKYVLPELKKRSIKGFFFPSVKPIVKKKVLNVNKIQFVLEKEKNYSKILKDIFSELIQKKLITKKDKIKYTKLKNKFLNKTRPYDNKNIAFLKHLIQKKFPENLSNFCCDYLFKKYVTNNEKLFSKKLYMSLNDLKNLYKFDMYIGAHGYNHNHLTRLAKKEKKQEIKGNIDFLKSKKLFKNKWLMCYPYGSYDKETIKILKKNNCLIGLTVKSGINFIKKKRNFYNLKRIDANELNQFI